MFRGITKRWLINTFGVVLAIIILLVVSLSITVESYCYGTIENNLNLRNQELSSVFPDYLVESTESFEEAAYLFAEDFAYKDKVEVEIINAAGRVIRPISVERSSMASGRCGAASSSRLTT